MVNYIVIASESVRNSNKKLVHKVQLTALIDEETGYYVMPSITFSHDGEHENFNKGTVYWDSPSFIFEDFKKYLQDILSSRKTQEQLIEFKDVASFLRTRQEIEEILSMINLAEKQNWQVDFDYKNQKEIFYRDKYPF